ncbi:translesion DNA synthesis-associated protein ImuA [Salinicola halophilus]|uniref:translesion DNA synthesis-associated protein ImuA n=1 Tax=Salinicola halophilus TaxID=184065 RepID=UPI000DA264B8|nr:translesion DNA synthesis-associated protein ImuA [Salinicola halophilus]
MSGLETLLDSRRVWRAQEIASETGPATLATGHAALDAVLPGRGWPRDGVSELLSAGAGSGELALLWPLLSRLGGEAGPVVLISPPGVPYPAAWRRAGVALSHCYWLDVGGREALWAAEQCLRAGCCAAVVAWLPQADAAVMRRLQVAAASGETPGFVHRPLARADEASPASLRLRLYPDTELDILKCRGGRPPVGRIAYGRSTPAPAALGVARLSAGKSSPDKSGSAKSEPAVSGDAASNLVGRDPVALRRLGPGRVAPEHAGAGGAKPGGA